MLFGGRSSSIKRLATASKPYKALAIIGIAALVLTTLASPSATRMFTSGWREIAAVAYLAPLLLLLLRAFARTQPLVTPPGAWLLLAACGTAVVVASALASPYRGSAVLWAAPLLAASALFLVLYDWVEQAPDDRPQRWLSVVRAAGVFLRIVALVSLALWLVDLPVHLKAGDVFAARNPYPLGHSNYTAGIALLLLPCAAILAANSTGRGRIGWIAAAAAALALLFTSGSRGGLVGLAALGIASLPSAARILRIRMAWLVVGGAVAAAALVIANPRLRTLVTSNAALRSSDTQRSAMLEGGLMLGSERPALGWGPGVTPLAYPLVRSRLPGGPDSVLQVHNAPLELWAEFGATGVAVAILGLILFYREGAGPRRSIVLGSVGYLVFSLTDWQFDVPVFAVAVAVAAALAVPAAPVGRSGGRTVGQFLGIAAVGVFALFVAFARRDPAPGLNSRALAIAAEKPAEAIKLLEESLALNPDQEIAHFNLGWLQVVSDPAKAGAHFLAAAKLVPNKGGVYFGLGLSELNRGNTPGAAGWFGLEALNDPIFLVSPWWRTAELAAVRSATEARVRGLPAALGDRDMVGDEETFRAAKAEASYVSALSEWIAGRLTSAQMLSVAATPARVDFFSRRLPMPPFKDAQVSVYYRERPGYPVLVRNLDIPVPRDLFAVQDNALAAGEYAFLFPERGWLPAPILSVWRDELARVPAKP